MPPISDGVISLELEKTLPADGKTGFVPTYKFAIKEATTGEKAGQCDLRVGYVRGTYFGGNIGYQVEESHRGHGYAARAVRLMLPLAKRHGMPFVRISCSPDNEASKATILHAGGELEAQVELPSYCGLYREGKRGTELIFRIQC